MPRRSKPDAPPPTASQPARKPAARGLAALLPESVLRGAAAAQAARPPKAPDEEKRKALRAPKAAKPKALPAPRPAIAVVASPAGVLVDERGRLPDLRAMPDGGCVMLITVPSGRSAAVAGVWGQAPAGCRWARVADLTPEDRADALAVAPDLEALVALADAEEAARAACEAAGVAAEDLAGLRAPEVLRLAADRLRRLEPTIRGVVWS